MTKTRVIGLGLTISLLLAACGTTASSATPGPTTATTSPSPAAPPSASAATADQTDTQWGRIWDTLPASFPTIQGATPAEEAATGPASATLAVNGDVAKAVITSLRTSLEAAGFSTTAYSGPLEDGTYVLDLRGVADDCKVNVTATPRGSLTTITILYGAACPHA
jgi:hypothetical protein